MIDELKNKLALLGLPTVIDVQTFDELLAYNISLAKDVLGNDWRPLEADPFMKIIRIITLRNLHNVSEKNEAIKQLLVTMATDINLDHIGSEKNIFRNNGEKPTARSTFFLSEALSHDVVIPKGTKLNDIAKFYDAVVVEDVTVYKGSVQVQVLVELQTYIRKSNAVCENIVTTIPYISKVRQDTSFNDGFDIEDDERYRMRIILFNSTYSTAGAVDAYIYHALSADGRIAEVVVLDENVLEVSVYLKSSTGVVDRAMLQRVENVLNAKSVRPLNDKVIVSKAIEKHIDIVASIEVYDISNANIIETSIKKALDIDFKIGQDFVRSALIQKCRVDGVYDIVTNFKNIICSEKELIIINSVTLEFKKAER